MLSVGDAVGLNACISEIPLAGVHVKLVAVLVAFNTAPAPSHMSIPELKTC